MIENCSGPSCDRQALTKGLCNAHYLQTWRGQELRALVPRKIRDEPCPIPGCDRTQHSRGLCARHMSICNRHHVNPESYITLYLEGCANPQCEIVDGLEVDHDHSCCSGANSCGKCVRGLLCHHCNMLALAVESYRLAPGEKASGILTYLKPEGRPQLEEFRKIYR